MSFSGTGESYAQKGLAPLAAWASPEVILLPAFVNEWIKK